MKLQETTIRCMKPTHFFCRSKNREESMGLFVGKSSSYLSLCIIPSEMVNGMA